MLSRFAGVLLQQDVQLYKYSTASQRVNSDSTDTLQTCTLGYDNKYVVEVYCS